jgi:hypothetical protein
MPYVPREKDKPVLQRQEGFFHVPELLEPKDRNEVFLFWGLTCGVIKIFLLCNIVASLSAKQQIV